MSQKKLSKARISTIVITAVTAVVVVVLIILNLFVPVKYLASYCVARNQGAKDGVMRVRFVDVGYGDCTIIELPDGKNMLIDGGNGSSSNQKRILKFLNKCDINTIDYLVCTSVASENCGGLNEILSYKKVKRIFMPYCSNYFINDAYHNFVVTAASLNCDRVVSQYATGEVNDESGYFFTFLSPSVRTNPDSEYNGLTGNPTAEQIGDASAVLWLEYSGVSFLFTSGVTDNVLKKICEEYAINGGSYALQGGRSVNLESCKVLQVPNHGNGNAAYAPFYSLTNPETAVLTVGKNGFDCPSTSVLSNVLECTGNENFYRTDLHGTVTIEVNKDGYSVV